ncbi:Predicted arabinose efflux permease, MFS family [Pimelobacter simplex]|nr:hypothetical protein NSI01_42620 [Pimelobacter simplex]SFM83020.1 Predicted arabinose efflux permease, MFS family [Pimelobacter simplex]
MSSSRPVTHSETRYTRLLRDRSIGPVWVGQSISEFGTAVGQVILAWTVLDTTGSAAAVGAVLACNVAAVVLCSPLAGHVVDHLARWKVVAAADAASCGASGLLAVSTALGSRNLVVYLLASFILGGASSFFKTGFFAWRAELAGEERLTSVNGLFTAGSSLGRLLGPASAGVVAALGGAPAGFSLNALSFGVALTATLLTPRSHLVVSRTAPRRTVGQDFKSGLRYVLRSRWLVWIFVTYLVANVAVLAAARIFFPLVAGSGTEGAARLGWIVSAQVLAELVGALVMGAPRLADVPGSATIPLLAGLLACGAAVPAVLHGSAGALLCAVLIGAGTSLGVVGDSMIQSRVPRDHLGRVRSVEQIVSFAPMPIGYIALGLVSSADNVPAIATSCAIAMAIAGLTLWAVLRHDADGSPTPDPRRPVARRPHDDAIPQPEETP